MKHRDARLRLEGQKLDHPLLCAAGVDTHDSSALCRAFLERRTENPFLDRQGSSKPGRSIQTDFPDETRCGDTPNQGIELGDLYFSDFRVQTHCDVDIAEARENA